MSKRYLRTSGGFIKRTSGFFDFLAEVWVGNWTSLDQIDGQAEQPSEILHQPEVAVGVIGRRFRLKLDEEVEVLRRRSKSSDSPDTNRHTRVPACLPTRPETHTSW